MPIANLVALALALTGSEAVSGHALPTMFEGAWGIEGARCGTTTSPRLKIGRRALILDNHSFPLLRIEQRKQNVVDVTYRADGKVQTDRLTVGTTGSRLFRERGDKLLSTYYRCEI